MVLEVPTRGKEERRQIQEFRSLCMKFDEKEEVGVEEDVMRKPERDLSKCLNYSFARVPDT